MDSGEIQSFSLAVTTSVSAAAHTLSSSNALIDVVGNAWAISGSQLVVRSTADVILDSTNYVSLTTSSPDPNSALFSISVARLDFGGGLIRHARTVELDLSDPSLVLIGQYLSPIELDNAVISGFTLGDQVPEPSSFALVTLAALVTRAAIWSSKRV